jgi:hypothetical protein
MILKASGAPIPNCLAILRPLSEMSEHSFPEITLKPGQDCA